MKCLCNHIGRIQCGGDQLGGWGMTMMRHATMTIAWGRVDIQHSMYVRNSCVLVWRTIGSMQSCYRQRMAAYTHIYMYNVSTSIMYIYICCICRYNYTYLSIYIYIHRCLYMYTYILLRLYLQLICIDFCFRRLPHRVRLWEHVQCFDWDREDKNAFSCAAFS